MTCEDIRDARQSAFGRLALQDRLKPIANPQRQKISLK